MRNKKFKEFKNESEINDEKTKRFLEFFVDFEGFALTMVSDYLDEIVCNFDERKGLSKNDLITLYEIQDVINLVLESHSFERTEKDD